MEFFRDFLDGPLYIVVVVIAVILIMAIIGYFMEKNQNEAKLKSKVAEINDNSTVSNSAVSSTPIENIETVQSLNESSVTNAEIPDVLNFDAISESLEKKDAPQTFTNVNSESVEISDSVEIPEVNINE